MTGLLCRATEGPVESRAGLSTELVECGQREGLQCMADEYHVVAGTAELAESGQLRVELDGEEILLCEYQGRYFALAYYCSHDQFPLHGGVLAEDCIECPYHGATFALEDGSVQAPPAYEPVRTYSVRVEGDLISVCVAPS